MNKKIAKPFLKWAGGKTQLINDIAKSLPAELIDNEFTYIEPFVGSGAVLFWMLNKFENLKKVIINDINQDLINVYLTIAENPNELIVSLESLQNQYHSLGDDDNAKKQFYYQKREIYNSRNHDKIIQAALFIFLNRTCFNGLYRVNRNNEFNVPIGKYKKPTICDKENILAVSRALQKVEICCGDYENILNKASKNTLFYFDPPYKPLNQTSSFNTYSKEDFDDNEQIRLKGFCSKLDKLGHHWILSNSDVKNKNPQNNFFDELYHDFNILRVDAKRSINSNAQERGNLKELLITNQPKNYVRAV